MLDDIHFVNREFLESVDNHIDLGGHNRYPSAVKIATDPTDYNGQSIRNHIEGLVEDYLPKFANNSIGKVTAESMNITSGIASEMKRVVTKGGEIGIMNSRAYVGLAENLHTTLIIR